MSMDQEFIGTIMKSVMNADIAQLVKMLNGSRIDFSSSYEDIPLEIGIRIRESEILVRVKIVEVKETDGDHPKTD